MSLVFRLSSLNQWNRFWERVGITLALAAHKEKNKQKSNQIESRVYVDLVDLKFTHPGEKVSSRNHEKRALFPWLRLVNFSKRENPSQFAIENQLLTEKTKKSKKGVARCRDSVMFPLSQVSDTTNQPTNQPTNDNEQIQNKRHPNP